MQVNTREYTDKIRKIVDGKNQKYIILTMGCQLNENDSEKLSGMLKEAGYEKTDKIDEANVIVFNTCCVRENAEDRLLGKLGEVKKYKEDKGAIIAIGGCMMQEKNMVKKIKESYKFVDILFGTHTLENFPKDLYESLIEKSKIEDIIDTDGDIFEGVPIDREDKIKASVLIMNGCNNFCTFCIVPYVRGRERSRNPIDIVNEVKCLADKGYKEITLLGQNVNSYLVSERKKNPDLSYDVDGMDVPGVIVLARDEKVDGVLVGVADILVPSYCKVCDALGLPCYATQQIVDVFSFKDVFKATCETYGIHGIPEYYLDAEMKPEDVAKIKYPVMIKPVDNGGGVGVFGICSFSFGRKGASAYGAGHQGNRCCFFQVFHLLRSFTEDWGR